MAHARAYACNVIISLVFSLYHRNRKKVIKPVNQCSHVFSSYNVASKNIHSHKPNITGRKRMNDIYTYGKHQHGINKRLKHIDSDKRMSGEFVTGEESRES